MAQNAVALRRVKVWANPDSGLTPGKFLVKIGSEEGPIIECSVVIGVDLTRTEIDAERVLMVQVRSLSCFHDVYLGKLLDEGYLCDCGRHLAYKGDIPLAVCCILQLPDGVQFEPR